MKNLINLILPITLILFGCTTVPEQYSFESQRTFDGSMNMVWAAVMSYFTEKGVSIKTIEKDSGIIYAEKMYGQTLDENWADCGDYSPFATSSSVSLNLFVRKDLKSEQILVAVNMEFSQIQNIPGLFFNSNIQNVVCNSKGGLELIILNYIEEYVKNQLTNLPS